MNTEKVFTAFDSESKEILLYRENSDTYIDLNKKEIVKKDDLDLESLRFISETIKILKYMPESLITKLYNYDRYRLINTKNILVGLKEKIIELKEIKTESGWYFYNGPLYNYHYDWDSIDKEMGLYIYKKEIVIDKEYKFKFYKNIYDGKYYLGYNKDICKFIGFDNGMEYVRVDNYSLHDIVKEPVLEKKKVYELANEARKEKLESECST